MRYLVFTNTPAHVHLYKNAVARLRERGHEVLVLARDYQCTVELLQYYDLPFRVYGGCESQKLSLVRNLPGQYASIVRRALRYDPDLVFGMGSYAAHAGVVTRTPTVLVLDSENQDLDHAISHPFAEALVTPHVFRKDLGSKHYTFTGYKECAYLHPDVYEPSPSVREELGVGRDEPYSIVRFNAYGSHHDVGEFGFDEDDRRELVSRLSEHGPVIVSSELDDGDGYAGDVHPFDLHPARLHDALAEASLLATDAHTMATEAGLLGTPTVRFSSFVGDDDYGHHRELERQGLVENYRSFDDVLSRSLELAADTDSAERWAERREEYVGGLADLTELIVETALAGGDVDAVDELRRRRGARSGVVDGSDTQGPASSERTS